ncbi:MAG: hypothetical protein A2Y10_04220 [Planctomycetes bacterium GWF2_41_51]|nr:MAG: hypothetical protein A2Y10_04220 [Planctomycetes bacterium GWF2_41_51]HBG28307.1 hypothetical protein [Phycisphaerales bacterium]
MRFKNSILITLLMTEIFICGCLPNAAGLEWGHVPSGTFADPDGLPPYGSQLTDGWGILYTLKAGSFDPDHRSGTARRTRKTYEEALETITTAQPEFTMSDEGSTDRIAFKYPANWEQISDDVKKDIALQIGEYVAFNSMVWHEMLSWYHARLFMGMDDFESAFSWEDIFCDLYGAKVAVQAIKMGGNFEENVTNLTRQQLKDWQVVPKAQAHKITQTVKGTWWIRTMPSLHSNIYMRHMDIGCGDGMVTAVLIPGFYDGPAASLEAPKLDLLDKYGLEMKYTVTTMHSQGKKLRELAGVEVVEPRRDFCKIIAGIQKEAESMPHFLVTK